jgi:hypothetical protein
MACFEILLNRDNNGDGFVMMCHYTWDLWIAFNGTVRGPGRAFRISRSGEIGEYNFGSSFSSISSEKYDPTSSVSERRAALEKLFARVM